jgi:phage terminase large subunit
LEECSEVNFEIYVQLTTRLRNKSTDHHQIILTTNPEMNWVKSEILLKAGKIYNADRQYWQDPEDINEHISVHISPTHLNTYLPKDYVDSVSRNRPQWWINRYLFGSFNHTDGLVYPMFSDCIVDPFEIPKHWQRITGSDFGLVDSTVMLAGAIDPKSGILYIYKEHYENGKSIKYHAGQMKKKILDEIPHGCLMKMVADPKGKARSEKDFKSTYDYYAEYDIYFTPGINKIEDGILKTFSYFEMGKLKIFNTCINTIREGTAYKYPKRDLLTDKNAGEKPVDKDNHAMDSLKYIVAELPDDPDQLVNLSYNRNDYYGDTIGEQSYLPHALQEEPEESWNDWSAYY